MSDFQSPRVITSSYKTSDMHGLSKIFDQQDFIATNGDHGVTFNNSSSDSPRSNTKSSTADIFSSSGTSMNLQLSHHHQLQWYLQWLQLIPSVAAPSGFKPPLTIMFSPPNCSAGFSLWNTRSFTKSYIKDIYSDNISMDTISCLNILSFPPVHTRVQSLDSTTSITSEPVHASHSRDYVTKGRFVNGRNMLNWTV